jgi:hypothetical protein
VQKHDQNRACKPSKSETQILYFPGKITTQNRAFDLEGNFVVSWQFNLSAPKLWDHRGCIVFDNLKSSTLKKR